MEQKQIEVCRRIAKLLSERFWVPQEKLGRENWKVKLTSNYFGMSGIDMTYLFFEVEKAYGIRIKSDYLDNYGFDTVEGIAEAVLASLQ